MAAATARARPRECAELVRFADVVSVPVLIGYFAKTTAPAEDLARIGVREICSVSECRSAGLRDRVQAWAHNDWGYYDTPDLAWSVVPSDARGDFELYAYELFPFKVESGLRVDTRVVADGVAPLSADFVRLGFDVVSRSVSSFFECSPLSCNSWALEVGANAFCLVEEADEAMRLALVAERSRCESGDYHVLAVWRQVVEGDG